MKPPVLAAPFQGKPLILYVAVQERSKLKHYFQAHTIRSISKANQIEYILSKPVLYDRLARWYLQIQQFEIIYVPKKDVKGQVLADFLADHPIPAEWELSDELSDEDVIVIEILPPWKMFFDDVLPYSFSLSNKCSNNVVEYQALMLGLEITVDMRLMQLNVYGDSQLVISQLLGDYEVRKPELIPYYNYTLKLMESIKDFSIEHVPRLLNKQANYLASLASALAVYEKEIRIPVCQNWVVPPMFENRKDAYESSGDDETLVVSVCEIDGEDWRQPLINYLQYGKLPDENSKKTDVRRRAPRFIYYKETLFRRSFDGVLL
ncbi:hypothetical protein LIER_36602 [Lithospermum erythrorhizon]|uniref:RNase H type-1 domain-containing protein n=1 Tax=Lithospermum erythrorhizon TaxID=34254 RepID=A0AAV3PCI8_LITER